MTLCVCGHDLDEHVIETVPGRWVRKRFCLGMRRRWRWFVTRWEQCDCAYFLPVAR